MRASPAAILLAAVLLASAAFYGADAFSKTLEAAYGGGSRRLHRDREGTYHNGPCFVQIRKGHYKRSCVMTFCDQCHKVAPNSKVYHDYESCCSGFPVDDVRLPGGGGDCFDPKNTWDCQKPKKDSYTYNPASDPPQLRVCGPADKMRSTCRSKCQRGEDPNLFYGSNALTRCQSTLQKW